MAKNHKGGSMNLSNPSKAGLSHDKGSSMKQGTSTGSGSRPGNGKAPIMSSAPSDASLRSHRAPPGALK